MTLRSINPATNELIKEYPEMEITEISSIIESANHAFIDWRRRTFSERANLIRNVAKQLRDHANEYGELMALEMGKPVKDGKAEAEKCAWLCDYYADNAERFLKPVEVNTDHAKSLIYYQPLGIILAIMPWNFPFWQVFRFAVPSLMAGNVAVLKHASNVSGCALAIENIFKRSGFPNFIFRTLLVSSNKVDGVIENPLVKAVTLTGSTIAGKAIASKAGQLIKKTVLELGGSDPYVILSDADVELAAKICVQSRLTNAGQSCIAAKRFIVVEKNEKQFIELFVNLMSQVKMGDPFKEETQMGPQARMDLRDTLHKQVQESIKQGARCLLGGEIPNIQGAFYPPTVLVNVKKGMPAYQEELFGPVAAVISAKDDNEAIFIANDSSYGLGSAIFTRDLLKGQKIAAEEMIAGNCFVNNLVKSDPRLPFGGIKESGYGRELSEAGIKEFVNVKTVCID